MNKIILVTIFATIALLGFGSTAIIDQTSADNLLDVLSVKALRATVKDEEAWDNCKKCAPGIVKAIMKCIKEVTQSQIHKCVKDYFHATQNCVDCICLGLQIFHLPCE